MDNYIIYYLSRWSKRRVKWLLQETFLSSLILYWQKQGGIVSTKNTPHFWQDVCLCLVSFSAQLVIKLDGENASTCSKMYGFAAPFWFLKEQKKDKKTLMNPPHCFQYFAPYTHSFSVCYTCCSKGGSLFCFLVHQVSDHWIGRRPPYSSCWLNSLNWFTVKCHLLAADW